MIYGEKIYLRAMEPEDVDLLYKWENDTKIWQVSNTVIPFAKHILKDFIENSSNDIYIDKQLRLIIVDSADDSPVGALDFFEFDPTNRRAGIGILIAEEKRNKSFASETLSVIIPYAFNTLHLHQLFCNIIEESDISLKLFKKHGFKVTGTKKDWTLAKGEWKNVLFLQLINDE